MIANTEQQTISKTRNKFNTNCIEPVQVTGSKFIKSHNGQAKQQYGNLLSKKQRVKNGSIASLNSQRSLDGRTSSLSNDARKFERILDKFASKQRYFPIKLPTEVRLKHPERVVIYQDSKLF